MIPKNAELEKPPKRPERRSSGERFRIEIEDSDKIPPGGQYVCGNGETFLIQAGAEVIVPRIVLEILDNAVEEVPIVDPRTLVVRRFVKRKKYPYQNLGPVAA